MTTGERINQRRKQLGLSIDDVAEKLGKNRATVYRYESNEIEKLPTNVLEPLAEVLGTTPYYLMGWEDKCTNNFNLSGIENKKRYLDISDLTNEDIAFLESAVQLLRAKNKK